MRRTRLERRSTWSVPLTASITERRPRRTATLKRSPPINCRPSLAIKKATSVGCRLEWIRWVNASSWAQSSGLAGLALLFQAGQVDGGQVGHADQELGRAGQRLRVTGASQPDLQQGDHFAAGQDAGPPAGADGRRGTNRSAPRSGPEGAGTTGRRLLDRAAEQFVARARPEPPGRCAGIEMALLLKGTFRGPGPNASRWNRQGTDHPSEDLGEILRGLQVGQGQAQDFLVQFPDLLLDLGHGSAGGASGLPLTRKTSGCAAFADLAGKASKDSYARGGKQYMQEAVGLSWEIHGRPYLFASAFPVHEPDPPSVKPLLPISPILRKKSRKPKRPDFLIDAALPTVENPNAIQAPQGSGCHRPGTCNGAALACCHNREWWRKPLATLDGSVRMSPDQPPSAPRFQCSEAHRPALPIRRSWPGVPRSSSDHSIHPVHFRGKAGVPRSGLSFFLPPNRLRYSWRGNRAITFSPMPHLVKPDCPCECTGSARFLAHDSGPGAIRVPQESRGRGIAKRKNEHLDKGPPRVWTTEKTGKARDRRFGLSTD